MISDLQAKVVSEGETAQKVYGEFAEWCEDRSKDLTFEIKTGKAQMKELKATIEQQISKAAALETEIEKLAGELKTDEADLKAATGIRKKESETFAAEEKELMEIVDTLQRTSGILERGMSKGGASMLQVKSAGSIAAALSVMVDSAMISTSDATRLTALTQSSSQAEDADMGAPAATVYEGHSGGILDVLGDMLEKAESQLDSVRTKETKDLHSYALVKQSLDDQVKFGKKEIGEAKAKLAAAGEKKAVAEGDLSVTSKDLAEDIKAKGELHHDCMTKATDFEVEVKSRGEELAALAKAKEVIKEATGGAEDLTYEPGPASLLQVSAGASSARLQAVHLVRELAEKHHLPMLAQLAARMSAAGGARAGEKDIFGKVKGLVSDMIAKLEKDAEADATHKAFCDRELVETGAKKDETAGEIERLSTKLDATSARSAALKEETAELEQALSKLATSQAETDKLRAAENAAYTESKAELEKGLEGVKMALKVLREYYAKEDKAHSSADGASTGIIGLLEVVESDFSKNLAEITSIEETAVAEYEQETKENEIETATKTQDVKYKTKESTELDKAFAETSGDREGVKVELDAVLEYLKKVEEKCIAKAETFEERQARFQDEVAGLKEALAILDRETALIQRGSRRSLRVVRKHA